MKPDIDAVPYVQSAANYDWLPNLLHLTDPRAPDITRDFIGKRRNENTQAAYSRILKAFLLWVERSDFQTLKTLTTTDLSNYVKGLQRVSSKDSKPLAKRTRGQVIACLRGYFDALVRGGVLVNSPASSVETYRLNVRVGAYKAMEPDQMGQLLDSFSSDTLLDLQERAIIALMAFSCARVSAVVKMKLGNVYEHAGRLHVCLTEKRDAEHYVPCHPELEEYLREFLARATEPGTECDANPEKWLFRRWDKKRKVLSGRQLDRLVCYRIVKRRARAQGLDGITNHTFRATGITTFLRAGGSLDDARRLANHSSVNTTKLYDHRTQAVSTSDVEMINYRRRRS